MRVETVKTNDAGKDTTPILYSKHINLFEVFSPDNLEVYQKAVSLTYGNVSFVLFGNQ